MQLLNLYKHLLSYSSLWSFFCVHQWCFFIYRCVWTDSARTSVFLVCTSALGSAMDVGWVHISSIIRVNSCTESGVTSSWGLCVYLFSFSLRQCHCHIVEHNSRATVHLQCSTVSYGGCSSAVWSIFIVQLRLNQSCLTASFRVYLLCCPSSFNCTERGDTVLQCRGGDHSCSSIAV